MNRLTRHVTTALVLANSVLSLAEDPVFSGPQVDEKLPPLKTKGVFGEMAGKEFDLVKEAGEKPILIVFFHQLTRPAFGLTNTLTRYTSEKRKGMDVGVVFLTDDATETEAWMHRVEKHFPKTVTYSISPDGLEGPGAYGLNRNVTLTVLVGKNGKVTGNFALVQPSLPVDGPKILQAIAAATGGGKVPAISELTGGGRARQTQQMRRTPDPELELRLRALINKEATAEAVAAASKDIEEYVSSRPKSRQRLIQIARRIVEAGKLQNYGTEPAQKFLKKWSAEASALPKEKADSRESDKGGQQRQRN